MLPELFLQRMQDELGDDYPAFLASYDQERHQALRLNPLKRVESGESMVKALTALFGLEKVPWAQNGFYYNPESSPGRHPYHEAGLYYIQEPSAMAPVGFMDIKPGDRVLDLCAAPGGKSTQIGAYLGGRGLLVSNEIHPTRAKILSENVERMGLANTCVTNESPENLAERFPSYFDRILVDAPCSGEGMFRKNEVALTEWSVENVEACAKRQDGILDAAMRMLRPGGRLVYSTCTFASDENAGSIKRFLERCPEMHPVNGLEFCITRDEKIPFDGMLQLYPHRVRGEGHFLAVLEKNGSMQEGDRRVTVGRTSPFLPAKECKEWLQFEEMFLRRPIESVVYHGDKGGLLLFGENLYLVPEEFPDLSGIKVLRPGLHLGTMKKNRFEPSHALALVLGPGDVRNACLLSSNQLVVRQYLNGQTFAYEGEKGWFLVCVDGVSLGWGKLAGGIMKNHYPKGLRIA